MMKFVEPRPYSDPAAAARKLVHIAQELVSPQGHAYTGVTNTAFTRAGGSVAEYGAGIAYGTSHGLFSIDESGTRITVKHGSVKGATGASGYEPGPADSDKK